MSTTNETMSKRDAASEGPPVIAASPFFHGLLAGYIALADDGKLQTASAEYTHKDWVETKNQIRELRQQLAHSAPDK